MSPSNLNRKIQHLLGLSTSKLVRNLRLQHAAELLNFYNLSVTETTILTGFFDPAHLSRHFKSTFGYSPNLYRGITPFFLFIKKIKHNE
ncbi:helix-turn-helix transcriptional regulator [Tenacibaculum sp. M341]|uniref:helix-turn-helix transcriptional regulator n=1 Tax=Tenacibaculum sp. M341 TaxID=2530339 RepID=UPI00104F56E3|nr:helix-turn-helix transcriptional regulator [uncultured Tenacibaculum sp.]TCI92595.1 AraC family transcriptional regulator [Tenacibaculum sp. M341]